PTDPSREARSRRTTRRGRVPPAGASPSQFTALRTASYCSGVTPAQRIDITTGISSLLRRVPGIVRLTGATGSLGCGGAIRAVPRARVGAARGDAHLRPDLHVADRRGRSDRLVRAAARTRARRRG